MKKTLTYFALTAILLLSCGGPKTTVMRPEVDAHGQRAYRLFVNGDLDKAAAQYKRGYAAARKVDDDATAARYLANVGRVYAEMGRHDSAALYLAAAYVELLALADTSAASRTAAAAAVSAAALGDGGAAKNWYGAASALSPSRGKDDLKHYHAVARGRMDWRLSATISGRAALDDAVRHYRKKKDYSSLAVIYALMADAEFAQGNCADAERYARAALSSADKTKELYRRSGILLKLSAIKFCSGDIGAGKRYYNRALDCAPRGVVTPALEEVSACGTGCR